MSDDLKYYVAPGVIKLTPAAVALASAFLQQMGGAVPDSWIASFDWATKRTLTNQARGIVRDLGAGLDICAARPDEIPSAAVYEENGLKYALQIPQEVVAAAERKVIDVDPTNDRAVRLL
jgi:hypothetical protein